jgi:ketosteroid isomerase-like protein
MDTKFTGPFLDAIRPPAAPATAEDNKRVLHSAYESVVLGDFARFADYLTDNAELEIRGFPEMDGSWRGRDEVAAAARANYGKVAEQKPEIEGMIADGNTIAVFLREKGIVRDGMRPYDCRGVQRFTFEGGRISRIDQIIAPL